MQEQERKTSEHGRWAERQRELRLELSRQIEADRFRDDQRDRMLEALDRVATGKNGTDGAFPPPPVSTGD